MSLTFESQDISADYWRAYFEWRAAYGLSDECMKELLAAIRVAIELNQAVPEQLQNLRWLATLIEVELEDDRQARLAA
jgi:hypothetical protein